MKTYISLGSIVSILINSTESFVVSQQTRSIQLQKQLSHETSFILVRKPLRQSEDLQYQRPGIALTELEMHVKDLIPMQFTFESESSILTSLYAGDLFDKLSYSENCHCPKRMQDFLVSDLIPKFVFFLNSVHKISNLESETITREFQSSCLDSAFGACLMSDLSNILDLSTFVMPSAEIIKICSLTSRFLFFASGYIFDHRIAQDEPLFQLGILGLFVKTLTETNKVVSNQDQQPQ